MDIYKKCYDFCESVNYKPVSIDKFAKENGLTSSNVISNAREYYRSLGNDDKAWYIKIDENKKLRKENRNREELEKIILKTPESKQLYIDLGRGNYSEYKNKLSKYCYEYCYQVDLLRSKVENRAQELGMSYRMFRTKASDYALENGLPPFTIINDQNSKNNDEKNNILKLQRWRLYSDKREKVYQELGGSTYIEFMNKLLDRTYDYFIKCHFDHDKVLAYCEEIDVSYQYVKNNMIKYLIEKKNMSKEEAEYCFIIPKNKEYGDRHVEDWIGKSKLKRKTYLGYTNQYGKLSYDNFMDIFKKDIYEFYLKNDFRIDKLKEYTKLIGISHFSAIIYARNYAFVNLGMTEQEWETMQKKYHSKLKFEVWLKESKKHQDLYEDMKCSDYFNFLEKAPQFCYEYFERVHYDYNKILKLLDKYDLKIYDFMQLIKEHEKIHPELKERIYNGFLSLYKQIDTDLQIINNNDINQMMRAIEKDIKTLKRQSRNSKNY